MQWKEESEVATQLYGWFDLTHRMNTPRQQKHRGPLGKKENNTRS